MVAKSTVARCSETAWARDGRQAADDERRRAASELGLPIDSRGRVLYTDRDFKGTSPNEWLARNHTCSSVSSDIGTDEPISTHIT